MQDIEKTALEYFSERIRKAVLGAVQSSGGVLSCITIRKNGAVSVVAVLCGIQATREEMDYTLDKLCKGSLYAYADEIRCGVITTDSGLRAGVCGTAVTEKGKLVSVRDISSVSLRIPHRIEDAADFMLPLIKKYDCILVYSRPAGGKTTVLRERLYQRDIAHRLSTQDTSCHAF